jgi:hypothetical protein
MNSKLLLVFILLFSSVAYAADSTTIGALKLVPSFENIAVYSNFTDDDNGNNHAVLEYRESGGVWKQSIDMTADRRDTININPDGDIPNPYKNQWRAIIFWLDPDTDYEVRVTYTDPDGVSGTNPVTSAITTRNDVIPLGTGDTFYVSPSGTDTACVSGNTFATVQQAADCVNAGDTVRIMPGTYNEQVSIAQSGTENNYITFMSDDPGNKAVITSDATYGVVQIRDTDYIKLKQLDIRSTLTGTGRGIAVRIRGDSVGNVVEECDVLTESRNWYSAGISIWGENDPVGPSNTLIQDNYITTTASGNDGPFGVILNEKTDNTVIRRNSIIGDFYDNIAASPNFWVAGNSNYYIYDNVIDDSNDDCIEAEGGGMNVAIWNNMISNCWMFCIATTPVIVGPTYIFRNTCVDTLSDGGHVKLGSWSAGGSYGYTYFYHNTLYQSSGMIVAYYGNSGIVDNMFFRNNIMETHGTSYIIYETGPETIGAVDYDYNSMYSRGSNPIRWMSVSMPYDDWRLDYGQEAHGIWGQQDFVNVGGGDFHLQSSATAIDKGLILPGFNDANSPWPYTGTAPDLGAYEFDSGAPTTTTTTSTTTTTTTSTSSTSTTTTTITTSTTTTTIPPCTITAASITPNCAGGSSSYCEEGETISMSGTISGDCSGVDFFQIDADSGCSIQYENGDMQGISDATPTIGGSTISGTWIIPTVPLSCQGVTVAGSGAGLYDGGPPGTGVNVAYIGTVDGSFTFAVVGGTTTTTSSTTTSSTTTSSTTTTTIPGTTTTTTTIPGMYNSLVFQGRVYRNNVAQDACNTCDITIKVTDNSGIVQTGTTQTNSNGDFSLTLPVLINPGVHRVQMTIDDGIEKTVIVRAVNV